MIEQIAEYYSKSGYEAFSTRIGTTKLDSRKDAVSYLQKYYVERTEYDKEWAPIYHTVFRDNKSLPEMIFQDGFEFICLLGGTNLDEENWLKLRKCLEAIGEKDLIVVQDLAESAFGEDEFPLRMKYPNSIRYEDLMGGSYISTVLFENFPNHYYFFGNSGEWGMYTANEYVDDAVNIAGTPIVVIGFHSKYKNIFRKNFDISEGKCCEDTDSIESTQRPNLEEWLPKIYKQK